MRPTDYAGPITFREVCGWLGFAVLSIAVVFFFLSLLTGCASVNQTAHSVSFNPKTGITSTNDATISVTVFGGSKSVIEKLRASGGATASVGATGMDQQSTLKDLTELIQAVAAIATKGAAAANGIPIP